MFIKLATYLLLTEPLLLGALVLCSLSSPDETSEAAESQLSSELPCRRTGLVAETGPAESTPPVHRRAASSHEPDRARGSSATGKKRSQMELWFYREKHMKKADKMQASCGARCHAEEKERKLSQ